VLPRPLAAREGKAICPEVQLIDSDWLLTSI
jgi:hypothetical protein